MDENTAFILQMGIGFWFFTMLPWQEVFGASLGYSVTLGWLAAGYLWIGAGMVRAELLSGDI